MASSDFTIADVLAWARTKPADERYDYQSRYDCALCHFLRDTGRARSPVVSSYLYEGVEGGWREEGAPDETKRPYEVALDQAVSAGILYAECHSEWTFGGLVKRLEKLCPETPVTQSDWAAIDAYLTDIEQVSA